MRRLSILIISLFMVCLCRFFVYAHPGNTDGYGGHWDYEAGEYHYHHGYPEHDHYDSNGDGIVDCPYDFDDQTGINSGSPSSGGTYSRNYSSYDYDPPETITVYKDREVIKEVVIIPFWMKCGFIISWFLVLYLFFSKRSQASGFRNELDMQKNAFEKTISDLNHDYQQKLDESSKVYQAVIRGKDAYIEKIIKDKDCK